MSFSNKTVLITGGSSGIGAATAVLFAAEGANVAIIGRNDVLLKSVEEKCAKVGKKPLVIKADVTNDSEVKKIVKDTVEKFGKLDVLINNAGSAKNGSILNGKALEAYDAVMNVNLRAIVNITTIAAPYLIKNKGNIINISSTAAKCLPFRPEFMPYSVSKAALDYFTRAVALELAPSGVRVNAVSLGPVITNFFRNLDYDVTWEDMVQMAALKRISEPEEIAGVLMFIASDKAKGMTGSIVLDDNGFSLMN